MNNTIWWTMYTALLRHFGAVESEFLFYVAVLATLLAVYLALRSFMDLSEGGHKTFFLSGKVVMTCALSYLVIKHAEVFPAPLTIWVFEILLLLAVTVFLRRFLASCRA